VIAAVLADNEVLRTIIFCVSIDMMNDGTARQGLSQYSFSNNDVLVAIAVFVGF